ncbi:unnamed protein product [Plutella xylostella]|uniref:(diamondback moth) hypothetical protein n=1 Tax=Plutella xylostella TaxID=51655 RepID=A0A8S4DN41_PLUXY|nr:unnamed protein product [Plutella xylostella]
MARDSYHKGKYYVTFKRGFEDCKKDITITVDKVYENDSLRIVLSDDEDPAFLFVLNVTRCDYEDLKRQQGLLIDFDNFPSQLVRLLQQCSSNNMFLIMQQSNPVQFYFEVVEHNEFKRLVHLSLKTAPASDTDVKKHMSDTIINLKKSLSAVKSSLSSSEAMWSDKCMMMERKLHDLAQAISKMEEDKQRKEAEFQESLKLEKDRMAQERHQWQKSLESNTKSQLAIAQENSNRKDKTIDELNSAIKQQKDSINHLELQLSEKSHRMNMLEKEVQKAHIEVATTKAKNVSLEREVMEREKQCHQTNLKYGDLEKTLRENSELIKELNNTIKTLKREKSTLEERLAMSESLANKNNNAAQTTSEQLLKANQIISKQNSDLIEIKEKLLCRTAIALEQEKVIEANSKEITDLKTEVKEAKQSMDKLRVELDNLKEKYENNDRALKDKEETIKNNNMVIQWLHKKMEDNCIAPDSSRPRQGLMTATSSTPYFLSNKGHNHNDTNGMHAISDESINFYATSKSDVEDSPRPEMNKVGLDPKYLKPAPSDRQLKSTDRKDKTSATAGTISAKGKENNAINLPQVDYREKKSGKAVSYRATPVSAYFP